MITPVTGPAGPAGRAVPRHQILTHLNVRDRLCLGLTLRQLLCLLAGLSCAYALYERTAALPPGVRWALTGAACAVAGACALLQPGGRGLEEWAFAAARLATVPRAAVWRPACAPRAAGTRGITVPYGGDRVPGSTWTELDPLETVQTVQTVQTVESGTAGRAARSALEQAPWHA